MKGQPHRLVQDGQSPFGGSDIDRSRPLRFRLNGVPIAGFSGDTVLSAALAAGIDTVGQYRGWPMALSSTFAPAIVPEKAPRNAVDQALPMARVPARDGIDYRVLGVKRQLVGDALERLRGVPRTLGVDLDTDGGLDRPWIIASAERAEATDLIVVGAGVAGMSAALAGVAAGLSVTLLEATLEIGGNARLFGTQDGEESPNETILRLRAATADRPSLTIYRNAEAFALRQGLVRAHVIDADGTGTRGRVVDFPAARIVLATGAIEQLPVFPGNRLPGVCGSAEAYALAHRYAVWPGRRAALATVSSPAYRLMMQAKDAGIDVARVIDGRPDPQSRFVAFSKAYGITMAAGTIPAAARTGSKGRGISLATRLSVAGFERDEPPTEVDRLVVCGGWQPNLMLWHMAGGQSVWSDAAARIEPRGILPGIELAGSALGLLTRKACLDSGDAAVARLLGHEPDSVTDTLIDPMYETPDGPAPLAERLESQPPAFLGLGRSLMDRPLAQASRWPAWLPFGPRNRGWKLAETPHPLEITDITAGVRLGAIPPASAGIVAQERVAMVVLPGLAASTTQPQAHHEDAIPGYLAGRFGPDAQLWIVASADRRNLDTGALIYRSADDTDPLLAIGAVVRRGDGAAMALLGGISLQPDAHVSLRDHNRAIGLRLIAPYRAGMRLAAPLGGGAGAP